MWVRCVYIKGVSQPWYFGDIEWKSRPKETEKKFSERGKDIESENQSAKKIKHLPIRPLRLFPHAFSIAPPRSSTAWDSEGVGAGADAAAYKLGTYDHSLDTHTVELERRQAQEAAKRKSAVVEAEEDDDTGETDDNVKLVV